MTCPKHPKYKAPSNFDKEKLDKGEYCRHGVSGCFCKVGWPYEMMCPDCRDNRDGDNSCRCVCPPIKWLKKQ